MGTINNSFQGPIRDYVSRQATPAGGTPVAMGGKPTQGGDSFTGPGLFALDAVTPVGGLATPGGGPLAAPGSNFKPVYSFTEEQTLKFITNEGNFKLVAGRDNNKDTISKKEIQAQIAEDEAFLSDVGQWISSKKSGTEVGEIFLRHNTLSNLEANFDNYAKNGELDLPTLQAAYAKTTGGANTNLTQPQKDKISPLVSPDGTASPMFGDIAKAGPNSSGTNSKDPNGTQIDSGDLDAAIANGNKPTATPADKAAGATAQDIKNDPQLQGALTGSPGGGGIFAEGVGFTIADVKRALGIT